MNRSGGAARVGGLAELSSQRLFDSKMLKSILGPAFAAVVSTPELVNHELFPEERQYIARAVHRRQAEFGMARVLARAALAQLGMPPVPLVPRPDRSPQWPTGIIGSITHTERYCAVAVTNAPEVSGLGIDVEGDLPLSPQVLPMICTDTELFWLAEQNPGDQGWLGKLFFSAKESFYKCQYPTTESFLDFREVELEFDLAGGAFNVTWLAREGALWSKVRHAKGKYWRSPGLIVTAAILSTHRSLIQQMPKCPGPQKGGLLDG
jgi:4'-phosphopantetheinyl transferase EntD